MSQTLFLSPQHGLSSNKIAGTAQCPNVVSVPTTWTIFQQDSRNDHLLPSAPTLFLSQLFRCTPLSRK